MRSLSLSWKRCLLRSQRPWVFTLIHDWRQFPSAHSRSDVFLTFTSTVDFDDGKLMRMKQDKQYCTWVCDSGF